MNMHRANKLGLRLRGYLTTAAFVMLTSAACTTIQIAPDYDPALVAGIGKSTNDIMSMYASTSLGTRADNFASRVDRYDQILGELDALAVQAQSRPIPDEALRDKLEQYLKDRQALPAPISPENQQKLADIAARNSAKCAAKLKLEPPKLSLPADGLSGQGYVVPSALALMQASSTIANMRNEDCAQGLSPDLVRVYKGQTQHYLFEAMAYEQFLNRQGNAK
ncbi:hypothetical protein AWB71_06047 [Caballeronia peredens]|nr:hypothetical protein AWB71_06047 [Caballeronia peredens]